MDIITVKGETLNWDEFQEWFKKRYGWYLSSETAPALRMYLNEQDQQRDSSQKETAV